MQSVGHSRGQERNTERTVAHELGFLLVLIPNCILENQFLGNDNIPANKIREQSLLCGGRSKDELEKQSNTG